MPLELVRQDITKMKVDAIVNAANTQLAMGGGVCGAIFRAAGVSHMAAACDRFAPIHTGEAVITPGFNLPSRYVIHTDVYKRQDGSLYPHLVADALTALALVLGLGADRDTALKALTSFKPGGHRIETVAEAAVEGGSVRFVDDSKATNGHAARASLSSFPAKSVIWIAGGLAKGSRFEDLVKDQAHTIKAAVIIGKDQQPMIEAFASQAPDIPVTIIDPEDNDTVMDRAVEACGTYAAAGDIVLMAPACASMDQFKSYADRGNRFAAAAKTWSEVHGLH